ncbi:sensor histidine kinase [Pueribacillus sp. YX66]|uniref:sensor histidine kinase n=1 Tax=Pueribacillus sp. YX66 TaxID=3229242 RepID=UPI00358D5303
MNKSNLTGRIWLSFIALIFLLGILIAVIYPLSIQGTLTEETYQIILQEQKRIMNPLSDDAIPYRGNTDFIERREAARSVGHALIINQEGTYRGDPIPNDVFNKMAKNAYSQSHELVRYNLKYEEATLFYVIRKIEHANGPAYLISYMWDTYRNQMIQHLWNRLLIILMIAGIVSLFPAILLTRYLRAPLVELGKRFEQIAKRNWKEPFKWEGEKEFETLSNQFELMRQNLISYDEGQKTFIQQASHELKTPIMIITSYAQSVKDGVMPKENIHETMDVILQEASRMEKRIGDMLYFSKLDALKDEQSLLEHTLIRFGTLASEIEERFRFQRDDVTIHIRGEDVQFYGDREQFESILDNLVQNAIRYAKDTIILEATESNNETTMTVFNNGPEITDDEQRYMFEPFQKGTEGKFGLGLAIVKRIAVLHGGTVHVENKEHGVAFYVTIPKHEGEKRGM